MAAGLLFSSLVLGAIGVFALPSAVSDFLADVTGIRQSTIKALLDPATGKIPLSLLPTGHGRGLDADLLDGQHASAFATSAELAATRADLESRVDGLNVSVTAGNATTLGGYSASFFRNAGSLASGTLSDQRLSGNVVLVDLAQTIAGLKTFSGGITVSGGKVTLPPDSIIDSALSGNVAFLSGSQTFSGSKSFAALLTAGSGFTVSAGPLSLPGNSILDSALSASVALLTGTQTFSGAKSFSLGITAPTSGDTINGLVINSGALSGLSTLALSGAITGATSGNTINGVIFSSGNATLANLTSSTGTLTSTVADGATAVGFTLSTGTTYSTAGAKLLLIKNNGSEKLFLDKDGNLTVNGNIVATGTIQGTQLISTVLTGTPPLVVSSTTQVANLNANFVQGYQAADLYGAPQPNLIPNSDFSRRTKWMTFMPETFADVSGLTVLDGGAPSVAGNTLSTGTLGGDGQWEASEGLSTWRDVRFSVQVKSAAWQAVEKIADRNNKVQAYGDGTNFALRKVIAGVVTTVATVASTQTANNWYWFELEAQGTTYIAKLYSSGVSPVAKSSATLQATLSGTITDAAVATGSLGLNTNNAPQWGGLSTGDGGVYVEGWGPEGFNIAWRGTKGGQAIGFDETANAGPIGKQWALRGYIPATSRGISLYRAPGSDFTSPSIVLTHSAYLKTNGKGGSGPLVNIETYLNDINGANINAPYSLYEISDAGETSWTRKSISATSDAATRTSSWTVLFNLPADQGTTLSATGTALVMLGQLEQGSVATPWRNAPEDFAPLVLTTFSSTSAGYSTTSTTVAEVDPRDLAANLFLPWDAKVEITVIWNWRNTTAPPNGLVARVNVDGTSSDPDGGIGVYETSAAAGHYHLLNWTSAVALAAGKHRVTALFAIDTGGTVSIYGFYPRARVIIAATKGR